MEQTAPSDLIPVSEAEELVGHSRSWFRGRVTIYRVGRVDKVSRSAVLAAKRDYDTPKAKDDKDGKDE